MKGNFSLWLNKPLFATIFIIFIIHNNALNAKNIHKRVASTHNYQTIPHDYLIENYINDNNCKKFFGKSCFFRDNFFSEKYFHQTKIIIFKGKIFAIQNYLDDNKNLAIQDGNYQLELSNKNVISFSVKNGYVSSLILVFGELSKENNKVSKCRISEILYNFYQIYNLENQLVTKKFLYKDDYNFSGINEYILFSEKNTPGEIMSLSHSFNKKIFTIENLNLCRESQSEILKIKHETNDICLKNEDINCSAQEECYEVVRVEDCEVSLFLEGFD